MVTNIAGCAFIESFEGCKYNTYLDIKGIPTIGVGHRLLPGESYPNGITPAQVDTLLSHDVGVVDNFLTHYCPTLTQNQHNALADFGFNLGVGNLHLLISHGLDQIPVQLLKWDHAGAVEVEALEKRRAAEVALWNKG